jgi:hypothetical protein
MPLKLSFNDKNRLKCLDFNESRNYVNNDVNIFFKVIINNILSFQITNQLIKTNQIIDNEIVYDVELFLKIFFIKINIDYSNEQSIINNLNLINTLIMKRFNVIKK